MIKKLFLILILSINIIFAQDEQNDNQAIQETNNEIINNNVNNTAEENNQTNFFNNELNNTNDINEPAILQDIRNLQNRSEASNSFMLIRAVIGFIITLVGIYLVYIYLRDKYKKVSGSSEIIKVLATTPVAANRYISIIEIIDDMYLVSVSDHNINLLSKIEDKETKDQIKMMYINSKNNVVDDSFKNMLNQTLSVFKQPKMKEKDPLQTTSEIRERLNELNSTNTNNDNNKKDDNDSK